MALDLARRAQRRDDRLALAQETDRTLKKDRLVEMLRTPKGATIEEITEAFGILPHSARTMISMTAKRLGVEATRDDWKAYRLPDA